MGDTLGVAVVGAGYWGPNLARNFHYSDLWSLRSIVDLDLARAGALADRFGVAAVDTVESVLSDPRVDAIAIATPARTHYPIAMAAIAAGKHVVVEKPLADSSDKARAMIEAAEAAGVVLMTDHTFCYTAAVLKIRDLLERGELGDLLYIDSVRINLGLVQPDVDVFWDLAPHDLSIMDFLLPGGLQPVEITAMGGDPLGAGRACVGHLSMRLDSGVVAHAHVNWLSPTKVRQVTIGGSRRTVIWDDLNPQQRVSIYDRGVDLATQAKDELNREEVTVSYRLGDTIAPALHDREALAAMVEEFADSIRSGRAPRTDGYAGLRVLNVLESAQAVLQSAAAADRD